MVIEWSNRLKSWTERQCADVRAFEAHIASDLVEVPRAAEPAVILAWSGPITDRARLEIRQVQALDYPVTMRFVLGTAMFDVSEEWIRLTGLVTLNDAREAAYSRPLGITGGVQTRRWTLRAALDPNGSPERVQCIFDLFVDRGVAASSAPFALLATGVAP